MRILLCLALALSGCGVVQKVRDIGYEEVPEVRPIPDRVSRPNFVAFEIETVLVEMADGSVCRGSAGAALGASGWSGVLSECPYAYQYAVELAADTSPAQIGVFPDNRARAVFTQGDRLTTVDFE